ncbi:hypothetical protein BaRGS_00031367, partial [Batillaria attramentaria]
SPAGKPGGYCNDRDCYDPNAICACDDYLGICACDDPNAFCAYTETHWEGVCECRPGYRTNTSDLTCEINPGRVGGACFDVDPVCDDPNAVCGPNTTCMCNEPFETADLNC